MNRNKLLIHTLKHPMSETIVNSAIETSVKFAFSGRNPESKTIEARKRLEQGTRGTKEKLLELGKSAAKALAKEGVLPKVTTEVGRKVTAAIWKSAEQRVAKRLKTEARKGNVAGVLATLNEIDPCNIPIQNLSAKPGERQERLVRRSVGLLPQSPAYFHEAHPNANFPDNPQNASEIILPGGQSFRREAVKKTLDGKARYQPMWRANDVLIPLVSSGDGQLHFITITKDQIPSLSAHLQKTGNLAADKEVQPKSVQIDFGGESDVGITRKGGPDEDSFFSGAKGKLAEVRLANASVNIAAYNESNRKGQIPQELKEKLLASQDQIRIANKFAEKIFTTGVDGLFIVADGMGGGEAGEYASQLAIMHTLDRLTKTDDWVNLTPDQIQQKLKEAISAANGVVFRAKHNFKKDLGSTLTLAMIVGGKMYTANVGDSRVYLYEESTNNLARLTKDHSLVEALVSQGQITDDERYTHPERSVIYRSLGDKNTADVDVSGPIEVNGKVKILAACDGAWEMVRDPQLRVLLSQPKTSKEIAKDIISAANKNGGEDNITTVVAEVVVK